MTDHDFANELRKWWSFDDHQRHTHSWHSREDFIGNKLPSLAAGDTQHARDLDARALTAERRARERACGVRNVGWNFPAEFYN